MKIIQAAISFDQATSITLVLVEHTPVYTTGMMSKDYSQEKEKDRLKNLGADYVRTEIERRPDHLPMGLDSWWLIQYLRNFAAENRRKALLGLKWYVGTLEQMVIDLIQEWGVVGTRSPHTGVWMGEGKI